MKGFMGFNQDLKCRGMQFEVGKTYTLNGDLKICGHGLHFCAKLESVYSYYDRSSNTRICEVEATGPFETEGDKSATLSLKIVRELTHKELIDAILKGNNSGYRNSGNYNSGYFNSNTPFVRLFNKGTKLRWDGPEISRLNSILSMVKPILQWVPEDRMTDEEKAKFPSHKTTGGFLKKTDRHDWSTVTKKDLEFIKTLPNFNAEVFKACTGFDFPNMIREKSK